MLINPIFLGFFRGGGGPDPPPLDPHMDWGKMFLLWISEILQRKFFLCKADLVSNMRVKRKHAFEINMNIILWFNMLNLRTYISK